MPGEGTHDWYRLTKARVWRCRICQTFVEQEKEPSPCGCYGYPKPRKPDGEHEWAGSAENDVSFCLKCGETVSTHFIREMFNKGRVRELQPINEILERCTENEYAWVRAAKLKSGPDQ